MSFDKLFFTSVYGVLKTLEVLFSLLTLICALVYSTSWLPAEAGFFNTIIILSLIYSIIVLIVYSFSLPLIEVFESKKIDDIFSILFAMVFSTSTSLVVDTSKGDAALTAAVVFGYMCTFTYLLNAILLVFRQ